MMRNLIKIVENADADNMHGDAMSLIRTLANKGAQEFTDKGRADIPSKPNNPRFADNSMTVDEEEGISNDDSGWNSDSIGDTEADHSHMDMLHDMLTRMGMTDLEIRQNPELDEVGKQKIAGRLGISPEEVTLLVASLAQELEDDSERSTEALLGDYNGGIGSPMSEDEAPKNKTCPECKGDGSVSQVASKDWRASKKSAKQRKICPTCKGNGTININKKESKRPFDSSVTERFSYERDSTGNVTVRDSETGKSKYIQGTAATDLLSRLDRGANEEAILAPLLERNLIDSDVNDESGYEKEIKSDAGTYNFPWVYEGKHGFATAFYRTDTDTPHLKLKGIRDSEGNEIENVDETMKRNLIAQAHDFIGEE